MVKELKFMFDRRFDLPIGSISSNVAEVVSSVIEEMAKPDNIRDEQDTGEDSDFPAPEAPEEIIPPEPTFSLAETEALKQESFNLGLAKGLEQANHAREEIIKEAINNIASALGEILSRQAEYEQKQELESIKLSVAVCKKLLPEFVKSHGEEEVEALLKQSLQKVADEPRITINVSPENEKNVSKYLEQNALLKTSEAKISLIPDETLQNADCIISWKNGSIERKTAETLHTIEDVVNDYTKDNYPESESAPEPEPEDILEKGDENGG